MNTSFDAHYDADESARAERIFYVRSIRELRLFSPIGRHGGWRLLPSRRGMPRPGGLSHGIGAESANANEAIHDA